jgi:hypothetical protein
MGMMNPMCYYPGNWSTFEGQSAAGNQKILDQFGHSVTAMREEAVKAHANAEAAGNPVKNNGADHGRPTPEK